MSISNQDGYDSESDVDAIGLPLSKLSSDTSARSVVLALSLQWVDEKCEECLEPISAHKPYLRIT